jgi:hypothetical protein
MKPATAKDIETVFNACFRVEQVELAGGAREPFYQPATDAHSAVLSYREDFASSALHEISHWCIAGRERRKLPDFGYWYNPDGRTSDQQTLFYQVEIKPQALEWIFSDLCGIDFRVSADNLSGTCGETKEGQQELALFEDRVKKQREEYHRIGLPPRAAAFAAALARHYQ